ncbi:MAG: DinB family protein [Bacteroidetes bacterium]|nr:DinB family protein [Bacteroidota bacterium]
MKEIYTQFTRFNLWANCRMAETFSGLPDEVAEQHIESSFPSARLTFLHIWDAELLWLKRLQGISLPTFPSKNFQGNMADVYREVLKTSQDFIDFVDARKDSFFGEMLFFKTISYGEQSQLAFQMVHHCMNHSTYHRGQLVTIGRQLGLQKMPPTDYIYYLRELGMAG